MTTQPLSLWPWMMPRRATSMKAIAADVARRHGVQAYDLQIATKRREIVVPRQVAMVEMMEAGKTSTQAAGFFGLDHTCALNARRAVARRRSAVSA